jgi:hypothetical protein
VKATAGDILLLVAGPRGRGAEAAKTKKKKKKKKRGSKIFDL